MTAQTPTRFPAGVSFDAPYQPLAACGVPNDFFYHKRVDDFDYLDTSQWTSTSASGGSIASAAGDGGLVLFTTAATNNDYETLQGKIASFSAPQIATAGKKMFFLARIQLSDITNSAFFLGLTNLNANPANIIDGIYFNCPSGSAVINLVVNVGGTAVTTALPTASTNLGNATNIDLSFHVTSKGDVLAYAGTQLVGYMPQSGTGTVNTAGVSNLPVLGPCARVVAPPLTAVNLVPTAIVQAGAVAAKTMTLDFLGVWKER